jgi:enediyne biosynthesis protein E3
MRLLRISPSETLFSRRGFRGGDSRIRRSLERVGACFLEGYHASIEEDAPEHLAARLEGVEPGFRGFAYEGGAMGLALLDALTPWQKTRFPRFVAGPGAAHKYMAHVGVGWAIARLPWLRRRLGRALSRLDPLLRWLAVDGYGFHEGYFHWPQRVVARRVPAGVSGYAARAFDQGLGRSLWFVDGAEIDRIAATIATFPPPRHSDLWSGVGLACAYAGGVDRRSVEDLVRHSGEFSLHLAQGSAFAAKARQLAGNPAGHTALACEVICGKTPDAAALITDQALQEIAREGTAPPYEAWRQRIRSLLALERVRT